MVFQMHMATIINKMMLVIMEGGKVDPLNKADKVDKGKMDILGKEDKVDTVDKVVKVDMAKKAKMDKADKAVMVDKVDKASMDLMGLSTQPRPLILLKQLSQTRRSSMLMMLMLQGGRDSLVEEV